MKFAKSGARTVRSEPRFFEVFCQQKWWDDEGLAPLGPSPVFLRFFANKNGGL